MSRLFSCAFWRCGIMWILGLFFILCATATSTNTVDIICQCGKTDTTVAILYDVTSNSSTSVCSKFQFCEVCANYTDFCLLCPSGYSGLHCNKSNKFRDISDDFTEPYNNKIRRRKRQSNAVIRCQQPDNLVNGKIELLLGSWLRPGSEIIYVCDNGFTMQGYESITCLSDGQWSTDKPVCLSNSATNRIVRCQQPDNLENAKIEKLVGSWLRPGSEIHYVCNNGYLMEGFSSIKCERDGKWSNERPRCTVNADRTPELRCRTPENLENGKIDRFVGTWLRPGSEIHYACNDGFRLEGIPSVKCGQDGKWSNKKPDCIAAPRVPSPVVRCREPENLENGNIERLIGTALLPGSEIIYVCSEGFTMQGPASVKCQSNGKWSNNKPRCIQNAVQDTSARCPEPDNLENGVIEKLLGSWLRPDSEIIYACNRGFTMQGRANVRCQPNGKWSNQKPFCVRNIESSPAVKCRDPENLANGIIEQLLGSWLSPGSEIIYACKNGFTIKGIRSVKCGPDGKWSNKKPECVKNEASCPFLLRPKDTQIRVQLPHGAETTWTDSITDALKILGIEPSSVANGYQFPVGSKLHYRCRSNFYIHHGAEVQQCQENGDWTGKQPNCLAKCGHSSVPRSPNIHNGNATLMGQWPWHVALVTGANTRRGQLVCGAVLLDDKWVMTAAHCVTELTTRKVLRVETIATYCGKYYRKFTKDDNEVQKKNVRQIIVHTDYNPITFDCDIALIEMVTAVEFSSRVQPVCLPDDRSTRENIRANRLGVVTGWGYNERGLSSEELMEAVLPVVSQARCEQMHATPSGTVTVTENMYCAGRADGIVDTCQGDSGGPMMFLDAKTNQWFLEGLVSWGSKEGCAVPNRYSGFTKVKQFVNWIRKNTSI